MGEATIGIFVGGRSTRMGSPKGLLAHPDGGTLLEHAVRIAGDAEAVLVGDATPYEGLLPSVARIADAVVGIGPIGGLDALLGYARTTHVITIACDMPFVTADIVRALIDDPREVAVLAARADDGAPFEPMLARWHVATMRPVISAAIARGAHGLSRIIAGLPHAVFAPRDERAIEDWDTPEDMARRR